MNMKHLISSRTALCLCGLTLCFNASAQGYVSYNHDAAKMNQITVQEIGSGGLTPAFYYDALHNSPDGGRSCGSRFAPTHFRARQTAHFSS